MNSFAKFLFVAASSSLLIGCSDDINNGRGDNNGSGDDAPGVYIGVSFQAPGMGGSTRSTTITPGDDSSSSSSGTEVGTDIENNVNEVLIILATTQNEFIGAAKVERDNIYKHADANKPGTLGTYHAEAKLNKTDLNQYYTSPKFSQYVNVYVVVNPNDRIIEACNKADLTENPTEWMDTPGRVTVTGTETDGSIWSSTGGGNFLMSNSKIAVREIPKTMEEWDNYSTSDKAFHLSETNVGGIDNSATVTGRGPVTVQRAAARLDFKDGSPKGNNMYDVVNLRKQDGNKGALLLSVQLQKMALVNMNNAFYYFERVSDNGLKEGPNYKFCGFELPWLISSTGEMTGGNYVVDYYASEKLAAGDTYSNFPFSNYFNYSFFDDNGTFNIGNIDSGDRWSVSLISDVLKGPKDNYEGADKNPGQYHVWRYVTENTIPYMASPYEYYQSNGVSTGIVFKARMIAPESLDFTGTNLTTFEQQNLNDLIKAVNKKDKTKTEWTDEDETWQNPFIFYAFGQLYYGWEALAQAAIDASLAMVKDGDKLIPEWNRTNSLYRAVFGKGVTGMTITKLNGEDLTTPVVDTESTTESLQFTAEGVDKTAANYNWTLWDNADRPATNDNLTAFKKAATGAQIAMYQRSKDASSGEWGYYCYYYYWNRHNDNGRDGIMGPMEFATVRNNVYKLAVTDISRLGHPRRPDNDPDSPTPKTPDESADVYLTVDSKVVPWVVRVNNIKF